MTEITVVNGRFDIIRTSKCWRKITKFLGKLLKTSRKSSLELQEVENCTTVAFAELITHEYL